MTGQRQEEDAALLLPVDLPIWVENLVVGQLAGVWKVGIAPGRRGC